MSPWKLMIGGVHLAPRALRGAMRLSALFRFDVEVLAEEAPPSCAALLGEPFALTLSDTFDRALTVRGVVTAVERTFSAGGSASFRLALEPAVAPLQIGQNSRVFQEMTAVDIVKKVLEDAAVPSASLRFSIQGERRTRPYCVQHREADWAFIERLLAEEGIYYWLDCAEGETVLVFADDSTAAPEIEGGAEIPFHEDSDLHATRDAVIRVGRRVAVAHDAVRLRDYNFDKPRLALDAKAGGGDLELYDAPGRFPLPDDGDHLARVWLEALRASRDVVFGESSTTRLRPGLVFEMAEHPIDTLNGRLLVTSVDFEAGASQADAVSMRWTAIPAPTPFRAPRAAAAAAVTRSPGGPQTGVVVGAAGDEIHPDKSGRIRVQLYWDREGARDEKASTWMRVGQFPMGGSMILPRIGWDVLVHHHEDDIDDPVVTSHLYDGQFPVPYALPANKSRTAWQTATTPGGGSSNEIRFEDKKGSEEMFLNASKDMNVVVGDSKGEKVGVDHARTIGSNHDVTIGSNLTVKVKVDQGVTIGSSESLSVSGQRSVTVAGSESATVGASRSLTVIKGSSLTAKGGRTVTVGATMSDISALGVSRTVLGSSSVTVGGSWISAAATGLDNITGGASAETVGGAKICAGASGCETTVKGALAETVGGAYVIAAGGNAGESATGALAITVGGALLANAPTIEIEADSEISITCGGSSLTIKSGSVEVKAPTLASPGATITKKGSTIKHN
jgi:type VI secretion system secreted protein VgrG